MRTRIIGIIFSCCISLVAAADFVIVADGQPSAVIVTAAHPSPQTSEAAGILQEYVARISGARLEICDESDSPKGPCIYIGASESTRNLGIPDLNAGTFEMKEERFIVRTLSGHLVLVGNEHSSYRGTIYAVYELLERMGCRWFFPGAYGEVIPRDKTLRIGETTVDSRPDFRFRNIWYSGWMPVTPQDAAEYTVWADRNKMNSLKDLSLPGDGTIGRIAPPEKYFESHPHIYAINKKGERDKEMLCLTEPDAVKVAAGSICDLFRANPDQATFGFAPPDGSPMCYCERCANSNPNFRGKGYGDPSLSDVWFRFANAVAKEVYKEFPDRWLFTNGYANRVRPPEGVGQLSPNLGIQSAMLDSCTLHSIGDPKCWQRQCYETVFDRWTRDLRCVFVYDYDPGKGLDGLPFPMLHNLMRDFPKFKERGVWGFWTEGQNCWMVTHLNYYVRARLMWNADEDVRAIVRDYCEKFYGAAADPIEKYVWTLENCVDKAPVHETFGRFTPWRVVYPPAAMRKLDRLMEKAVRLAKTDWDALHVRAYRLAHDYLRNYMAMEYAAAGADFAGAVDSADAMLRIRTELGDINPVLIPVTPEWCAKGDASLEFHKAIYLELLERTNGTRGNLAAMTPRAWDFRKDPEDMGVLEEWYLPGAKGPWEPLDTTLYWEAQGLQDSKGYGYTGKAWYRTSVEAPADVANKQVFLTIGGLYSDKVWIWVNGFLVDQRMRQSTKVPFDVDVTSQIKPGVSNHIAIQIETLAPDRNARGGLHRRVFLHSK